MIENITRVATIYGILRTTMRGYFQ